MSPNLLVKKPSLIPVNVLVFSFPSNWEASIMTEIFLALLLPDMTGEMVGIAFLKFL